MINQWCYNAQRLGYTIKEIKKKVKGYPRNIKKRILKTFNDLSYVEKTNRWFNEMKREIIERDYVSPEENIKKIFRMGSKFYIKTGNLKKTFKLMNKRIKRIEND